MDITITIITISPRPNVDTAANNLWEAGSRLRWKIWVRDLHSPRSNYLSVLQKLRLQLSTPWAWGILKSCLGGHAKDMFQIIKWTDIKILATRHPVHATCHTPAFYRYPPYATCVTPPSAQCLQLNISLDAPCRSILGMSRVFHWKLLADGKLWVSEIFISKMYFGHWEPLGVSESCRTRIPGWSNP